MTGIADQAKFLTGNLTKHIISTSLTAAAALRSHLAFDVNGIAIAHTEQIFPHEFQPQQVL